VTLGLFEAKWTNGVVLAGQLQALFGKHELANKIICYVKDEGTNLSTMTNVLNQIVTCENLGIKAPFESICFGHAFSKACQYTTFDEKVSSNLQPLNIKVAQSSIQSCITWPKKISKGRIEWTKACLNGGL